MLSNTFKINCATDRQITHSSAIIICLMFYLYNSNCLFSEKKKSAFESRHTAFITFLLLELPQHIRHFFLNDSFLLGEQQTPGSWVSSPWKWHGTLKGLQRYLKYIEYLTSEWLQRSNFTAFYCGRIRQRFPTIYQIFCRKRRRLLWTEVLSEERHHAHECVSVKMIPSIFSVDVGLFSWILWHFSLQICNRRLNVFIFRNSKSLYSAQLWMRVENWLSPIFPQIYFCLCKTYMQNFKTENTLYLLLQFSL